MELIKEFSSNNRLSIREFAKEDWIDVHKYASLEIVCQYQTWGPNTEEDTQNFVDQVINDAAQYPRTRFAFAIVYQENVIGAGEFNIRDLTIELPTTYHPCGLLEVGDS